MSKTLMLIGFGVIAALIYFLVIFIKKNGVFELFALGFAGLSILLLGILGIRVMTRGRANG